eukprot:m.257440 g.257440  ORF g.257440 m.257440 type:complete len:302 (-) comp19635_c0_seq7:438-1343(-)
MFPRRRTRKRVGARHGAAPSARARPRSVSGVHHHLDYGGVGCRDRCVRSTPRLFEQLPNPVDYCCDGQLLPHQAQSDEPSWHMQSMRTIRCTRRPCVHSYALQEHTWLYIFCKHLYRWSSNAPSENVPARYSFDQTTTTCKQTQRTTDICIAHKCPMWQRRDDSTFTLYTKFKVLGRSLEEIPHPAPEQSARCTPPIWSQSRVLALACFRQQDKILLPHNTEASATAHARMSGDSSKSQAFTICERDCAHPHEWHRLRRPHESSPTGTSAHHQHLADQSDLDLSPRRIPPSHETCSVHARR